MMEFILEHTIPERLVFTLRHGAATTHLAALPVR
jgi:hypothetical protein